MLSAGGGYYYCAQQFAKQAQNFVGIIERAKPVVAFDSVEIDQYRFQIRLKNLKIDTNTDQNALHKGEPLSFSITNTMVVCYNPFTKKATITSNERAFSTHLIQGQQNQEIKYKGEDDVKFSLSFKEHPHLNALDFHKFLTMVTELSIHRPKTSMIDVQTGKQLVTLDPSFLDIKTHFPENEQEDAEINFNFNLNNINVDNEFFKTLRKFVVRAIPDIKEQAIAQSLFRILEPYIENTTERGEGALKLKMSSLNHIINETYDTKQGLPTISGFYKADGKSNLHITKTDIKINTEPKFLKFKIDGSGKFETKMRAYFASHLKDFFPFPINLSDKDALDISPDFASLGDMKISYDLEANLEKSEGKITINMVTDHYTMDAKVNYTMATGGRAEIEITNHEQLFADLNSYFNRVFSHAEIKAVDSQGIQERLREGLVIGKTTLESMGKKEERNGKTVLKIDQSIPGIPMVPNTEAPQTPQQPAQ